MALFASVHLLFIAFSVTYFIKQPSLVALAGFIFSLYFLPVVCFRIQNLLVPLESGTFDFSAPRYCPWWGAHQMQQVYAAAPHLEGLLRIIPGVYSTWLRLWGSRVGKSVYWTPRVQVIDRTQLQVGDNCVFGHQCGTCAHVIYHKDGKLKLKVGLIKIGKNVLVGAGSRLGPGTIIVDNINIPVCTDLMLDQHVTSQNQLKKVHHDPLPRGA